MGWGSTAEAAPAAGRAPRHRQGPGPNERPRWWREDQARTQLQHADDAGRGLEVDRMATPAVGRAPRRRRRPRPKERPHWWRTRRGRSCVAARRGRSAAGPAWLVKATRAGPDGRTDPLRHRRLYTDSPSRAATAAQLTRAPPGCGTDRVLGTRAEPWRSDISERRSADVTMVTWRFVPVRRD